MGDAMVCEESVWFWGQRLVFCPGIRLDLPSQLTTLLEREFKSIEFLLEDLTLES